MSKRARKEDTPSHSSPSPSSSSKSSSSSSSSSKSSSSSSSSYLLVTHSHNYADRTYGDVKTTHYPSLSDLLSSIRSNKFLAPILASIDEVDEKREEDPEGLLQEFMNACSETKESTENEMADKEDDFCDFRHFELIKSLIIVHNDGSCHVINA